MCFGIVGSSSSLQSPTSHAYLVAVLRLIVNKAAYSRAYLAAAPSVCLQSVRTAGVCRVLTIPRSVYNSVAADFPVSSSSVLDNLVARAEEVCVALAHLQMRHHQTSSCISLPYKSCCQPCTGGVPDGLVCFQASVGAA